MRTSPEELVTEFFTTSQRLPGQVFQRPAQLGFQLADSSVATTSEMWSVLSNLSRRFGDHRLVGVVTDDLRHREATIEPLAGLDLDLPATENDLLAWLRRIGPGRSEPLYVDARIVAFVGDSRRWGAWVDQDTELAILGFPRSQLGPVREELTASGGGPWFEASDVDNVLGPAYFPKVAPAEVLRELRRNYGAVRD